MKKKTILSICMFAFACMMSVCLASCGDDNDDPKVPEPTKATSIKFSPYVYVTESTLKYFDVDVTDASGTTTRISLDNTTAASSKLYGYSSIYLAAKDVLTAFFGDKLSNNLRVYALSAETFKTFPQAKQYTVKYHYNGTQIADNDKVYLFAELMADIESNTGGFDKCKGSLFASITQISKQKDLDKLANLTFTNISNFNFENASSIEYSHKTVKETKTEQE